jgi:hypothetical protein
MGRWKCTLHHHYYHGAIKSAGVLLAGLGAYTRGGVMADIRVVAKFITKTR